MSARGKHKQGSRRGGVRKRRLLLIYIPNKVLPLLLLLSNGGERGARVEKFPPSWNWKEGKYFSR